MAAVTHFENIYFSAVSTLRFSWSRGVETTVGAQVGPLLNQMHVYKQTRHVLTFQRRMYYATTRCSRNMIYLAAFSFVYVRARYDIHRWLALLRLMTDRLRYDRFLSLL